jgi:predicted TIM-barrel fold metal-dependent hydrolase
VETSSQLTASSARGIERILFAVDRPFVTNKQAVQWMETVPLCDEEKAKILSGNAKRLFRM